MQERDVLGQNLGLYYQAIIQRHDLYDITARLDHAADSVDQQLLDDATYRRADHCAVDPVIQRPARGGGLVQLGTCLVELSQRLAAELAAGFFNLALHFLDSRFGAGNGECGGVHLPAVLYFCTAQA
ncbi:hypothetical protein D3C79_797560 [compost metagenome]